MVAAEEVAGIRTSLINRAWVSTPKEKWALPRDRILAGVVIFNGDPAQDVEQPLWLVP